MLFCCLRTTIKTPLNRLDEFAFRGKTFRVSFGGAVCVSTSRADRTVCANFGQSARLKLQRQPNERAHSASVSGGSAWNVAAARAHLFRTAAAAAAAAAAVTLLQFCNTRNL